MNTAAPYKIVMTGPESSGKTSLGQALAKQLDGLFIPEFARYYLNALGAPYSESDFVRIACGQAVWEIFGQKQGNTHLILDTDWTVLHIWQSIRFPKRTENLWEDAYSAIPLPHLYILCAPDFPWQPDPLREHPDSREALFSTYKQLLDQKGLNYLTVSGSEPERLKHVLQFLHKQFL
jgi:nicotinamide riboside kinase